MSRGSTTVQTPRKASKRSRFFDRTRWMLSTGFWTYYPEKDLYVEIVSYQEARFSTTGKERCIPNLMVYGREVFEADGRTWQAFLSAHPAGMDRLDCNPARDASRALRGIPKKEPSVGLHQPDAFAMTRGATYRRGQA